MGAKSSAVSARVTEETARRLVGEYHKPVAVYLAEWRRQLAAIAEPYFTGPLTKAKQRKHPHVVLIDFGGGAKVYGVDPDLTDSPCDPARARSVRLKMARDAWIALDAISTIEAGCHESDVFRATVSLGQCFQRMKMRPFESLALHGKRMAEAQSRGGKRKAKLNDLQKADARRWFAEFKAEGDNVSQSIRGVIQKMKASHSLTIGVDVVKRVVGLRR